MDGDTPAPFNKTLSGGRAFSVAENNHDLGMFRYANCLAFSPFNAVFVVQIS